VGSRADALLLVRQPVGEKLRLWREKRGLSQLRLGLETGISTRHLSCVETGRSAPSRELILRLADHLEVPPRERNDMLLAAGYAPASLDTVLDPPPLAAVGRAIRQVLDAFGAVPAMAVDRMWNLVDANEGLDLFTHSVPRWLCEPPINILRLSLHPDGLPPRIVHLERWRADLLGRLHRRLLMTADAQLRELYEELLSYTDGSIQAEAEAQTAADPVMPLTLLDGEHVLSLLCTPVVFGTPDSLTVAGLAIKTFLPADEMTAALLARRHRR
jgi:transcriptional regulator with XRE-family HTH domain